MAIKPIFLFSVSRSGSTLIQRIIAAHDGVATVSEPWLLLPLCYTLRRRGVDAEYSHTLLYDAIEDFCGELPAGCGEYRKELRELALRLYARAAGDGASHFLDKSPPYCLVAAEVMQLFPDAKFVFLWRNPLSIAASVIDTWEPWRPTLFPGDLFTGIPRLVAAYASAPERCHAARFEDLVGGEQARWQALMDYLEIDFEPDALQRFAQVRLHGRAGDPTGVSRYSTLSAEPGEKWKRTFANPLRRAWARRYLRFLGDARMATMGYDRVRILTELDAAPATREQLLPDLGRALADALKEPVRVRTRNRKVGAPNVIRALLESGP